MNLDLVKIFTTKEQIAGLSVSDDFLRLVLLGEDKKQGRKVAIRAVVEEELPKGTMDAGAIKNSEAFSDALKKLKEKSPYSIDYVILTIPHYQTYSKIFHFPKIIKGKKLEETMNVTVGFNLPVKIEDVYLDWEKLDTDRNELFLQTIPRSVVDVYTKIFNNLDINIVALESDILSIPRVIDINPEPTLIISKTQYGTSFVIIKNRIVRFVSALKKDLNDKQLEDEIKRISDFYEAEDAPISEVVNLEETKIVSKFLSHPQLKEKSHLWLSAVGAGLRALVPRSSDELISLLPVGTEDAYETHKNVAFVKFISDAVTAISVFFIISYIGSLIFIGFIVNSLNKQIAESASPPIPQDAVMLEEKAKEFNNLVSAVSNIDKNSPRWSRLLTEIREITTTGISITRIDIQSETSPIEIRGIGSTRENLNTFRDVVESSEVFTDVNLPTTNLQLRSDIPFSMRVSLRDPSFLHGEEKSSDN